MEQAQSNRRDTTRVRALKGAKIVFNNQTTTMDCTIRNLSETGAKIVLATPTVLPEQFRLRFEDGREFVCEVRWRKLSEFGVEFMF